MSHFIDPPLTLTQKGKIIHFFVIICVCEFFFLKDRRWIHHAPLCFWCTLYAIHLYLRHAHRVCIPPPQLFISSWLTSIRSCSNQPRAFPQWARPQPSTSGSPDRFIPPPPPLPPPPPRPPRRHRRSSRRHPRPSLTAGLPRAAPPGSSSSGPGWWASRGSAPPAPSGSTPPPGQRPQWTAASAWSQPRDQPESWRVPTDPGACFSLPPFFSRDENCPLWYLY